ncbi:FAD:protein FMN transferase [Rugamonas sp. DEMB1]|uniref:FAD:protein FMN transferase n=1 Tax=Rugamonas sp. DEMB1 TaxID=3039386 RepID=UPI00244B9917|nr:FAD:protein FMN transferase [Rugamonas sp. DEMB1]WGG51116.1 FAD:protein FMN transferase [Rugamonas sp. DEMB1]
MMRRAQPWLGTLVEISVADALPDEAVQQAISQAFAEVALVHRLMSFHAADSDVARLNRAWASEVLAVHPHTWQVLRLAQRVAEQSDHIFNIACAPRLVAWGCLPAPQDEAPSYRPGLTVLRCQAGGTVRKAAPGWVDLGGIAKGYAVDLALAALQRAGVASACVNAGGDLRAIGPDAWPVRLRSPRDPGRVGATLALRGEALATSAGYFSAREHNGQRVCALVDGRDGSPAGMAGTGAVGGDDLDGGAAAGRRAGDKAGRGHGPSVSVRAASCAVADALTKVVLASGDVAHPALRAFQATALII